MTPRHPRLAGGPAQLSVGVAAADPLAVGAQLDELARADVGLLHFDVMDGRFAGPVTGSVALLRGTAGAFATDVHLMVEEPECHVDAFLDSGAHAITFHPETSADPAGLLRRLREAGAMAGVALVPDAPLDVLEPLIGGCDLVLVLGVCPRRRGAMDPATGERAAAVRALGAEVLLSVDGGVDETTIDGVARMGCDVVVSGSAVFAGGRPAATAAGFVDRLRAVPGERPTPA